jgi:hypothetical protein
MVRLAAAAADVIPMAIRKELVTLDGDFVPARPGEWR